MKIFNRLFKPKRQGKDFVEGLSGSEKALKGASWGLGGAAVGAGAGAGIGAMIGKRAIKNVPFQEVTVDHFEAVTQEEFMGYKPPNDYVPGTTAPLDDGIPTEQVFRDNPVYNSDGSPKIRATSTTYRGQGAPQAVEWRTEDIEHHKMDGNDYSYRAVQDTERYVSHYKTVKEYYPTYYQDSNGNTQVRWQYRTKREPVHATRTVGFHQRYTPNIESRVVGTVEKPVPVRFEHGISLGSYILKGALFGAVIGALAGGVAAAIEERFREHF